jgi:hypothetical protein
MRSRRNSRLSVALAAASPPAPLATAADPIFAAIEVHRAADAAHNAAIADQSRLELLHGFEGDWEDITGKASDDEFEAFEMLLGATATTLHGLYAKLEYLQGIAEQQSWMLSDLSSAPKLLIESFSASLRILISGGDHA